MNREAKETEDIKIGQIGEYLFNKLSSQYKTEWNSNDILIKSLKAKIKYPYAFDNIDTMDNTSMKVLKKIVIE